MSDLLLGTIIGGLIGLVSSVSTLVIQGHYSKTTTRMQIDARVGELRKQFDYQQKQAQTERLTGLRAQYLTPIGQRLQSITQSAHAIEGKLRDLVNLCGNDEILVWTYSHSGGLLDGIRNNVKHISEHMDAIEMLRTQNTDSQLGTMIQDTLTLGEQFSKRATKLQGLYSKHGEGDMTDHPNMEVLNHCMSSLHDVNDLFESIRRTNRRIEEIKSGME